MIAVDRDPDAPGFRHADRRAIVSAEDEQGIDRLVEAERVDGLIAPGIDWPVGIAARVAARRGLPHPLTPEAAALATSKVRQRERFAEAGVPQPGYRSCRTLDDARDAVAELGRPCVVKAPDRSGPARPLGRRGRRATSSPPSRRRSRSRGAAASSSSSSSAGQELTVNAFLVGGRFHALTVTDRHVAEPPAFGVALTHSWPSAQPTEQIAQAIDAARRAAAALGIAEGPTYTQVIVSEEGAVVGELAARLGGGHDAELCRVALGVDLNGLAISAALGEEIRRHELAPHARVGGACVRFLVAPPGELRAVRGLDDAFAVEGVARDARLPPAGARVRRAAPRPRSRRRDPRRRRLRGAGSGACRQGREPHRLRDGAGRARRSVPRTTRLGFQPPAIDEEEISAVAETLRSGWLTTGPKAAELERRAAELLDAEHVLAVSSGTAAMHLALVALGIGPGDEVITTPITWPATANVIVHTGATPVFADVRDADLNIDPDRVAELVGERTKAILPVDLAGQPCDLDPLLALGIPVVEDAAHAFESAYRGRKVGGDRGRDVLLALRDEERRRRRGRARRDESRRRGRRGRRPPPDAARRRLALRHRRPRLQGEPLRRARGDRARAARQARAARARSARASSRSTTTGSRSWPA